MLRGRGKDGLDTGFSRGIKAGTKVATTAKVPLLTPKVPLLTPTFPL